MDVMERLGGMAPVLLFLLLLALQIVLRLLPSSADGSKKQRLSTEEAELVRQIKQLNREAAALNTPATFAKSSKLRRAALAKEKELALMKQSSGGTGDSSWIAAKLSLSLVIKGIVILGVGGWFRQINVVSVPASLLQPFGGMLAGKGRDSDMVHVSLIPWMLLSTTVASYLVESLWHRHASAAGKKL